MKEEWEIKLIIDRYADQIYRLAYLYMHCDADANDIVQEVIIKWLTYKKPFHDEEHEKAWLLRVTHNLCKSNLRLFWRRKRIELSELEEFGFVDHMETDLIYKIATLPERYKIIIYLHYYEGYKEKEIANILQMNESTIRSRMARARALLKCQLEEGSS